MKKNEFLKNQKSKEEVVKNFLFCLLTVSMVFVFSKTAIAGKTVIDCDIHSGPCSKIIDNISVVFDINPKPVRSMSELIFSVTLKDRDGQFIKANVIVDLTMPGMFMGHNRVLLEHKGNGRHEGKGTIVQCPSGERIWKADVFIEIPSKKTLHTSYVFEVKN